MRKFTSRLPATSSSGRSASAPNGRRRQITPRLPQDQPRGFCLCGTQAAVESQPAPPSSSPPLRRLTRRNALYGVNGAAQPAPAWASASPSPPPDSEGAGVCVEGRSNGVPLSASNVDSNSRAASPLSSDASLPSDMHDGVSMDAASCSESCRSQSGDLSNASEEKDLVNQPSVGWGSHVDSASDSDIASQASADLARRSGAASRHLPSLSCSDHVEKVQNRTSEVFQTPRSKLAGKSKLIVKDLCDLSRGSFGHSSSRSSTSSPDTRCDNGDAAFSCKERSLPPVSGSLESSASGPDSDSIVAGRHSNGQPWSVRSPDISKERVPNLKHSEVHAARVQLGDVDAVDIKSFNEKPRKEDEDEEECSDNVYQLLFEQYARLVNGRLLMNATDLERCLRNSAVGARAPSKAKLDASYSEQVQLQQDLRFKYGLSRMDATRGICFEVFVVVMGKVCPRGFGGSSAREQHKHYAGSARLARGARLICVDVEPLAW